MSMYAESVGRPPSKVSLEQWQSAMPLFTQAPLMLAFAYTRDVPSWIRGLAIGVAIASTLVGLKLVRRP